MKLTTLATRNIEKVEALAIEQETLRKETEAETRRLMYDIYQPMIRGLENERDKKITDIKQQADFDYQQKRDRIIELNKPVHQVERILEFLRLDTKKCLTIKDDDIKTRNTDYKEAIGYYYKDEYLKAKLYIVENGKPKNKYSLVIFGKCLFHEGIIKLPRHYVSGCYTLDRYELEVSLRDFPAIDEAKAWLEKVRDKLDILDTYQVVKQEYIETKAQYNRCQFKDFIVLKCKCGFFYTTFDISSYRTGYFETDEVTCPRCRVVLRQAS